MDNYPCGIEAESMAEFMGIEDSPYLLHVEIDGWRDTYDSESEVFKGTQYTVNRVCIATVFRNGVADERATFSGECCDALAHNWACGWFDFDETPRIDPVNWFEMLV